MKSILLILMLSITSVLTAQKTQDVTVNIILKDIMSLNVAGDKIVNLEYNTQDDYLNGVKVQKEKHLEAFSTQNYVITSQTLQNSSLTSNDVSLNGKVQNLFPRTLFTSKPGARTYDVEYSAKGDYKYINKERKSYPVNIRYTIVAN